MIMIIIIIIIIIIAIIIIIIIIIAIIIIIIIIIIRFSVDAPLHRECPHKLILIINGAIRNVEIR